MPVIKGHHQHEAYFTNIPNAWLRDKNVSLAARALYFQILSHVEGWSISQESLAAANGIGKDSIRTMLNELMAAGYLERSEKRQRNDKGYLTGYVYTTKDPFASTASNPALDEPTLDEPPLKKNINLEEHKKPLAKATPMAPNSSLTESMTTWAVEKSPNCDPYLEFEKFKNWHLAKGSTMKNWDAAWRTWILNSLKYSKPSKDEIDPWAGKQRFGFDND